MGHLYFFLIIFYYLERGIEWVDGEPIEDQFPGYSNTYPRSYNIILHKDKRKIATILIAIEYRLFSVIQQDIVFNFNPLAIVHHSLNILFNENIYNI